MRIFSSSTAADSSPTLAGKRRRHRSAMLCAAVAGVSLAGATASHAQSLNGTVTLIPISTTAYGANDLNSVAIARDNLATVGGFQFTAFYKYVSNSSATVVVGRRATGSNTWTLSTTPYTVSNSGDSVVSGTIDDHDIVAMAVDGNGSMHLSWGMHNIPLNYSISAASVTGATFNPTWTQQTAANNPNLFQPFTSSGISQATYPEFYYIPNAGGAPSGNLLYDYRNAASASGGGSGNGNTYWGTYTASTNTFTAPTWVLNGGINSVNGYQNNLTYDSTGKLLMTWTWRGSPNFQSNQNILYAQSPDNGVTWFRQGGTTQYTTPIISDLSGGGSASQVAQIAVNVPTNSSLINTTGMTVDNSNNPMVATWLTPNGNAGSAVSASNNPNRQYVLQYYTGTQWKTSQISSRTSDSAFDTGGGDVRDLGRPLVLVDPQNRVLVVTRSEDSGLGTFKNSGTTNNNIVVYWNTVASLNSANPLPWQQVALDSANMGEWEPTYDPNLWKASHILDLFYEPSGITGQTTGTASVLQWDEQTYFSTVTPASVFWDSNTVTTGVQDGGGTWNQASQNFSNGSNNFAWVNGTMTAATFGTANGAAGTVTLGDNITVKNLTFNAATSGKYTIAGGGFTLTLASGAALVANVDATISAPLSASGTVNKTGSGVLTLSGANAFIGGKISFGTGVGSGGNVNGAVRITSASAVGSLGSVSMIDGGSAYDVFQIDGSAGSITLPNTITFTLAGGGTVNGNVIENVAGSNTLNSIVNPTTGGNQYAFQSDAGLFTVASNFNLGALASARFINLQGAGNGQFTGVLGNGSGGGTLGINKYGTGTWTLANTNTASGAILVSAGTLAVAGSVAGTAITVNTGATLSAAGGSNAGLPTTSALTVAGTAKFSPGSAGAGVGSRTIASLTLSNGGLVQLLNPIVHADRQVLTVTSTLAFGGSTNAWQGKLDLAGNDLIVKTGNLANLTNQLKSGFNMGGSYWNGNNGIVSTSAATDTTLRTTLGILLNNNGSGQPIYSTVAGNPFGAFDSQNTSATDVLIKYTWYGDADLNGTVNGTDYSQIDNGFNTHLTGWINGDFNYDGTIDGTDYSLIDNVFNTQAGSLDASGTTPPATPTAEVAGSIAAVPEPTSVLLLPLAAFAVSRRKRA